MPDSELKWSQNHDDHGNTLSCDMRATAIMSAYFTRSRLCLCCVWRKQQKRNFLRRNIQIKLSARAGASDHNTLIAFLQSITEQENTHLEKQSRIRITTQHVRMRIERDFITVIERTSFLTATPARNVPHAFASSCGFTMLFDRSSGVSIILVYFQVWILEYRSAYCWVLLPSPSFMSTRMTISTPPTTLTLWSQRWRFAYVNGDKNTWAPT